MILLVNGFLMELTPMMITTIRPDHGSDYSTRRSAQKIRGFG